MRNSSLFWGVLLIAIAGLFILQAMDVIVNVTGFLWPLFLMALGVWILLGAFPRTRMSFSNSDSFSVSLQEAQNVRFKLEHGAGQVLVTGGAPAGVAVTGTEATGMEFKSRMEGDTLRVKVEAGPSFLPFIGPSDGAWQFKLSEEVPVDMKIDAGATSMDFDLSHVKLTRFKLDTGASSTSLKLPAEGQPFVEINSGAASVDILVPQGMAARIRTEGGAMSVSVDERFPQVGGGLYQSPDFDTAVNRAEIRLEGGANSVSIHS
jgi:hypothetical protein